MQSEGIFVGRCTWQKESERKGEATLVQLVQPNTDAIHWYKHSISRSRWHCAISELTGRSDPPVSYHRIVCSFGIESCPCFAAKHDLDVSRHCPLTDVRTCNLGWTWTKRKQRLTFKPTETTVGRSIMADLWSIHGSWNSPFKKWPKQHGRSAGAFRWNRRTS